MFVLLLFMTSGCNSSESGDKSTSQSTSYIKIIEKSVSEKGDYYIDTVYPNEDVQSDVMRFSISKKEWMDLKEGYWYDAHYGKNGDKLSLYEINTTPIKMK